jgi:hypothetical protein
MLIWKMLSFLSSVMEIPYVKCLFLLSSSWWCCRSVKNPVLKNSQRDPDFVLIQWRDTHEHITVVSKRRSLSNKGHA